MPEQKFNVRNRLRSFAFAFNGLVIFFRNEHNARIHAIFAVGVIFLGWLLKISITEWTAIILSIGLVVIAEIFNTAIEAICDFIHPEINPRIKAIKDLAAGGVLLAAFSAMVIGLIISGPKLFVLLSTFLT